MIFLTSCGGGSGTTEEEKPIEDIPEEAPSNNLCQNVQTIQRQRILSFAP